MSGRALVLALVVSFVVVGFGAVAQDSVAVIAGMASMMGAGLGLAIKTDDTSQPMHELLFEEQRI